MPRSSRKSQTPPPRPGPEVLRAWKELYEDVFYSLMLGVVKAEGNESSFAEFREDARLLTKKQLRTIANLASDYLVEHANPSLTGMSREESDQLKRDAVAFALRRVKDGKNGAR
jgi:hypothetical protein